jgi:hypothetical protein
MLDPIGAVSISLGSVVLDRPDQTGQFIAKDLAGGWAYLIGDAEGDNRFRGHGVCEGGLDLTLRCAFLSAANHVPDCTRIKIIVDTRQAHRMMVRLAVKDPHVVTAIGGRQVSVMTRPDTRASYQVRTAAEQAAATALRKREHAEWSQTAAEAETTDTASKQGRTDDARPTMAGESGAGIGSNWRARFGVGSMSPTTSAQPAGLRAQGTALAGDVPVTAVRWFRPLVEGARNGLAAAGILAPRAVPRHRRTLMAWQRDLDTHVAMARNDLLDAGV